MSMKQRNEAINFASKLVNETLTGQGTLKGKSAYEIAVLNGFVGTESEWVASLKGQPLDIKGQYNTYQLLKGANPDHSYMYAVGNIQPYDIYFWSNPQNDWINAGKLNGINEIAVGAESYFPVDNKILLPDFATANQGTKADNAMPKSGGTMTGALKTMVSPVNTTEQTRNMVVYPAGTDVSTVNVSAGTIICILK